MITPFRKLFAFFIAISLLLMAVSVSAHDLPIGGSRWCFGKNNIVGNIDLKPSLFAEIKEIQAGHYNLDSISNEQLQKIATDIIQPYINKKLSITVDDKTYPVKVIKIVNTGSLFTIWLSVDNVTFNAPATPVKIVYSLLFEETNNAHVNLAYGYLSDATGNALQKVFDFSQPAFQTTFDSKAPAWEVSIKGSVKIPVTEHKTEKSVVSGSSESIKARATQKSAAGNPPASVSITDGIPSNQTSDNGSAVLPSPSLNEPTSEGKTDVSISHNSAEGSVWNIMREFIPLGIEHILTGYDHIAFLLALIVIGLSFKEVLKIITAFTVAHSITLLLAALQIVRLDSRFVESTIALSICYVAVENLLKKKVNYRWIITFVFGLVHGFGFASALQELIVGKSNLLLSVLSFNTGVELGQLMIVCVMLPLLYLIRKKIEFRIVTAGASVSIFVLGFAWFIERVFDLKLLWF